MFEYFAAGGAVEKFEVTLFQSFSIKALMVEQH